MKGLQIKMPSLASFTIVLLTLIWNLPVILGRPAFQLGIRDSFMIAHSFHNHPSFGPAGGLHGATYTCDVEFGADELHPELAWVIDIGLASDILSSVLQKYNYQNLDDIFGPTVMTTTEFMCRQIHQDILEQLKVHCPNFVGDICVKLGESHKAWASYTAAVN
jgi:6-pyruvoyltetrahydropterin/6-carboxytetrahydropterin synthase